MEEYGGGAIEARHGYIPIWLLVVYAVLFIWGLYYAYHYWGGLGPGRIYLGPAESREVDRVRKGTEMLAAKIVMGGRGFESDRAVLRAGHERCLVYFG